MINTLCVFENKLWSGMFNPEKDETLEQQRKLWVQNHGKWVPCHIMYGTSSGF